MYPHHPSLPSWTCALICWQCSCNHRKIRTPITAVSCLTLRAFPCRSDSSSSVGSGSGSQGLGHFLDAFDKAWAAYLQRFVAWKFADAAALESELIKVAIEMEASVLSKTGGDTSPDTERSEDLQVSIFGHLVVPHLVSTM